ncbi:hypothetical protein Tco_1260138 [Tanacetum coccineum]
MAHIRWAIIEEHRASMEAYKKEIKEKLAERREQMAIRAYEEDQRREKLNQKIEEKIEKLKNLIQYFIRNPISSVKTLQPLTTKTTEKGVGKEGFSCGLNKSKGSHLGLRHCAANRKRKKRKGPFVWTKPKSRVVIVVGQTKAIDGGLTCDNRLANYEQPCQHFLMFDYDPQEGELHVKTWDPEIT